LFPVPKSGQKGRAITYTGKRGPVTINLDSVEGALARATGKLPEVKKVLSMRVAPSDGQKVAIHAELIPSKEPSVNMREFGYRISDQLAEMAERILGENEVAKVDICFPRLGDDLAAVPLTRATLRPAAEPTKTPEYEEEEGLVEAEADDMPLEENQASRKRNDDNDLLLGAGIPQNESADVGDEWAASEPALNVDIDELASEQETAGQDEPRTDPTLSDEDSDEEDALPEAEDESGLPPAQEDQESEENDDTIR
jgi:hypothetical protein